MLGPATTKTMQPRRLTFACELDSAGLAELLADGSVIAGLQALGAHVALMLSDFSEQRAAAVRKLNVNGIPVIGIPLVPYGHGYYFTAGNPQLAVQRYEEWKAWTEQ